MRGRSSAYVTSFSKVGWRASLSLSHSLYNDTNASTLKEENLQKKSDLVT